jgi:predicted nucleic-acid-binding Zn-ribbon protein
MGRPRKIVSAGVEAVVNRDPVTVIRDPVTFNRDPVVQSQEVAFDHTPIVRVTRPVCPKCGCSTWRVGGTTRPNVISGEMLRWRKCAKCGQPQYHASPMTEEEKRRYSAY